MGSRFLPAQVVTGRDGAAEETLGVEEQLPEGWRLETLPASNLPLSKTSWIRNLSIDYSCNTYGRRNDVRRDKHLYSENRHVSKMNRRYAELNQFQFS